MPRQTVFKQLESKQNNKLLKASRNKWYIAYMKTTIQKIRDWWLNNGRISMVYLLI